MEEKIYLIEDTHADYHRFYLNKATNKQEALEKFWKDCGIDTENEKDIEEGYKPRTKRQFRVFDVEQELNGKGKTLGVW
jgi:hypothetical protein